MPDYKRKKTLLLIAPTNQRLKAWSVDITHLYQPLGLGIVAALTPSDWKIKIMDESVRPFAYYDADLVGITAMTSTVTRAYELASIYRAKGVPVVLGGIHATMMPEEASRYVDVVFKGEAETMWGKVLEDFENNRLEKFYEGRNRPDTVIPKPRRDLFYPLYPMGAIQTTRGCPMNCDFCSVTAFNGNHYRFRPVEDVLDELEEIPQKSVAFVDDNIIGHTRESKENAKMLFEGMIRRGLNKEWGSQATVNFADDPELLTLAKRSGCKTILLGIESEKTQQLKEVNKAFNIRRSADQYNQVFKTIHKHGIAITGTFIFGFDNDDAAAISDRVKFINKSHVDMVQATIMTPLPGTRLFQRLLEEGRLRFTNFPEAWQFFTFFYLLQNHPNFTPHEFEKIMYRSWSSIYAPWRMLLNAFLTIIRTRSLRNAVWTYTGNITYRRIVMETFEHFHQKS